MPAAGSYPTTVSMSDPEGGQTTASATATVADAPLTSSGVGGSATEQTVFTRTVARFADADPGRPVGHYSATVSWGDGSTTPGTVVGDPAGGYDVNASHTYTTPGSYTTTTAIGDADGSRTTTAAQTSVADAPLSSAGIAINAVAGQAFPANLAVFTDADAGRPAGHYSASVNWGDGSPAVAATITADSGGAGYGVGSSHTYAKAGSYQITVTITDSAGGSRTVASSAATVAPAPPPPAPPQPPADTGSQTHAASSAKPGATPTTTASPPARRRPPSRRSRAPFRPRRSASRAHGCRRAGRTSRSA